MDVKQILVEMEHYAKQEGVPIISAPAREILLATVRQQQPKRILEIGTAIGYSALSLLTVLEGDAKIISIDLDPDRIQLAARFLSAAGCRERVELLTGDAGAILPLLSGHFDFVFIDGAKGHYLEYLTLVLDKLTPGSFIAADNVLFRGWVRGSGPYPRRFKTIVGRMREYLALVTTDPRFATVIHEIGDGLAITEVLVNGA